MMYCTIWKSKLRAFNVGFLILMIVPVVTPSFTTKPGVVEWRDYFHIYRRSNPHGTQPMLRFNSSAGHVKKQEEQLFFYGKHKLYGLKIEVCVLPVGLSTCCTQFSPRSISEISIISRIFHEHFTELQETEDAKSREDVESLEEGYPGHWSALCDN